MLLRLLPAAKAGQAAPPTILFTLPLVTAPYTSKSLPLPPNLLTHRNNCAKEGIECSNVLLGDKAAWIVGIVDEVTFSVRESRITASLVDGSSFVLPITAGCNQMLDGVIRQVHLSFANTAPASPVLPTGGVSRSGSSGSTSGKRTPSALLSALLSPIMANVTQQQAAPPAPVNASRLHRRQARSLLVDAFRRCVLPSLTEMLPSTYMLWTLQGELRVKKEEWAGVKNSVDQLLAKVGHLSPMSGNRISSYSSIGGSRDGFASTSSLGSAGDNSDSDSDVDSTPPLTPATSVWNQGHSSRSVLSPLGHLSTLPACVALPSTHRANYANLVSRLASLASRLTNVQKTIVAIEKEEGRKRWLESLEASRQLEKANRRALSSLAGNKVAAGISPFVNAYAPVRSSGLWQSYNGGSEEEESEAQHPALLEMETVEEEEDDDMMDEDVFSPHIVVRPISPLNASSLFSNISPTVPSVLQPAPSGSESLMPQHNSQRRASLGDDILMPPPSSDKLSHRRPSLEAIAMGGSYRIVAQSDVDSDDVDENSLLGGQLHDIPGKTGEAGFKVGVAIVR